MNALPLVVSAAAVGAGIVSWAAVHPTSEIFGPTLHHTPGRRMIALTFDDGPNPSCTPQLLELLTRHRAAATFFLIGRFAREFPDLVREIAARGHAIGNHTQTHPNLAWMPGWRITKELKLGQESILGALGFEPKAVPVCMRPPFGYRGPQLWSAVRAAGLRSVVMWSLGSYDWRHRSAGRLIERLAALDRLSGRALAERSGNAASSSGEIVLLHDGDYRRPGTDRPHVLAALEHWLPRWRDGGYDFVTMAQLVTG